MPLERKRRRTSPRRSDRTGSNWVRSEGRRRRRIVHGRPPVDGLVPKDIMTTSTQRHRPSHTCACERACVRRHACGALLGRFCAGVRACERAHLMLQRESAHTCQQMRGDAAAAGAGRSGTRCIAADGRIGRRIGRSQREYSTVQRPLHRGGGAGTACSTSIQDTRSPESTLWHP
jgi:hypothetical protein